MHLRFVPSESTGSYFQALQGYLATHGFPVAFYSDRHSAFRINRDAQGGSGMMQFGRALAELNIEIICANSSQAKGRVERANRTLQDRLVKELRLENVCDMDTGNMFLPGFLEHFNERFALVAANPEDLHRPLHVKIDRLDDVLCHREQRYVSDQLTMPYDRKQIILERSELCEGLAGKYVDLYEFPDGTLEVDQRVTRFPIASSARISVSATLRLWRTSDSAMLLRSSRHNRTLKTSQRSRPTARRPATRRRAAHSRPGKAESKVLALAREVIEARRRGAAKYKALCLT